MSDPCICVTTQKVVVLGEKRSKCKARVNNVDCTSIEVIKIDGCVVPNDSAMLRCDHGVREGDRVWLIEIKGRNISDAADQIISTFSIKEICGTTGTVFPVIVSTKCPVAAYIQPEIRKLKKALGNRMGTPIIRTRVAEIGI